MKGRFVLWVGPTIVVCVLAPLGDEDGVNGNVLFLEDGEYWGVFSPVEGDSRGYSHHKVEIKCFLFLEIEM